MTLKHGLYRKHPLYAKWCSMRDRCNNPRNVAYANYGGRGIKVCAEWDDFKQFIDDMGLPPEGCSLDRIDNDKGYSRENCRWATIADQNRNCRSNHFPGQDSKAICEAHGINYNTFRVRVSRGYSLDDALRMPKSARRSKCPTT